MSTSKRKAVIIGTGGIARAHVQAVKANSDRVELSAALDIDADRVKAFADTHAIPSTYTDLDTMLNREKPDIVHVCTPPGSHAELSIAGLEAGAWVLCEKPLCASLAELDQIQAAETKSGNHCASVFQWRFGAAAQHLSRLIQTEAMGKLLMGICQTTWYRDHAYYAVPWRGKWDTELGGPTMGHGIHAMDLFLWLMGPWTDIRAVMATLDRRIEVEDISMAVVRFERGALGSIVNSILSPRQETHLRFDFQQSTVESHILYGYKNEDWQFNLPDKTTDPEAEARLAVWQDIDGNHPSGHGAQLMYFLNNMDAGQAPLTSGPQARQTIEFLASLYKSAISGEAVARGSITPDDPFYHRMNGQPRE